MTIVSKVYVLPGGSYVISDPALAFVNLSVVHRTGVEFDPVLTTPGSRECEHNVSGGQLIFLDPGSPTDSVGGVEALPPETVQVIYSY